MTRVIKSVLRDIPLANNRVQRQVVVLGVTEPSAAIATDVSDELRLHAVFLLGVDPISEATEVITSVGEGGPIEGIAWREVPPGTVFEVNGIPLCVRDAPLAGEVILVMTVQAEVCTPELFEVVS